MITKNFIKMCEKNEYLQKAWKSQIGDKIKHRLTEPIQFISPYDKNIYGDDFYRKEGYTYLPTQEQLWEEVEELLFGEKCELNIIVHDGKEYIISAWQILKGMSCIDEAEDTYTNTYEVKGENMKECLLKLIMKINWGKTWTGEKWVKAE